MNEDQLSKALRSLPRQRASSDFRAAVLRRLDEETTPRPSRRPLLVAVATGVAVAVTVGVVEVGQVRRERLAETQRVEALRQEYQALERDLDDLRRVAAEARPVLGIEGDDADFFVDLRSLAAASGGWALGNSQGTPQTPVARPASYQGKDR
jgi:hypothetical protein